MKKYMTTWFWVRAVLLVYSAFSVTEMVSPEAVAKSNVTWIVVPIIAGVILPFVSIASLVAIRVSKTGAGPQWNSNPFRSFVDFFHLGAWCCLAGGIGAIAYWITTSPDSGLLATSYFTFGLCATIGVKIGTLFGKKKPNQRVHSIAGSARSE